MDTFIAIERRAWRSEDTEANNFNAVCGAWPWANNFFGRPLLHWSLQFAISQRPIVFAPEGLALASCVTLNRAIRSNRSGRA
jgi:hypothetical protein